jgi:ComB9 competence protein
MSDECYKMICKTRHPSLLSNSRRESLFYRSLPSKTLFVSLIGVVMMFTPVASSQPYDGNISNPASSAPGQSPALQGQYNSTGTIPGTPGNMISRDVSSNGASSHAAELINSFEANSDVEAQVKGDYPAMDRQESLPLGAIQHAWDRAGDMAGVYTTIYNPHKVIRLRIREFMTTSVILPQWEVIESTVCGDKSAFHVQVMKSQPHILLIEPGAFIGTDTTLTAFGKSGNVYVFYLRGEGYNSKNVSDVAVYIRARQVYQTGDGKIYQAKQPSHSSKSSQTDPTVLNDKIPDYLEEVTFDPSKLNFDFSMAGDSDIAPERVYSDGILTWFGYGAKLKTTTLPTIYNVVDGIDTPINVNREGNKLVAQAAGSFTLRSGQKVTCVYPSKKPDSKPKAVRP